VLFDKYEEAKDKYEPHQESLDDPREESCPKKE